MHLRIIQTKEEYTRLQGSVAEEPRFRAKSIILLRWTFVMATVDFCNAPEPIMISSFPFIMASIFSEVISAGVTS